MFDYFDALPPAWQDSDEAYLRTLTPLYLKTTLMQGCDFGMAMGLLPMALPLRIGRALQLRRRLAPFLESVDRLLGRDRPWELSLLGTATFLDDTNQDGHPGRYHQRVGWLREVRLQPDWRFWGGLYPLPQYTIEAIEADCGPVRELFGHAQRLERNRSWRAWGRPRWRCVPPAMHDGLTATLRPSTADARWSQAT